VASLNAPRAVDLLERAITTAEPLAALRAITALRLQLDALERQQVARALREGRTFSAIAAPLGISRQAAHRRYRSLKAATPLAPEVRATLIRAREEATRHGADSIASTHLVLALASSGLLAVDVDGARRSFAPPAINAPAPKGMDPALRERLVHASGPLRLNDLLRAALADAEARALLERFRLDRSPAGGSLLGYGDGPPALPAVRQP